MGHHLVVFSPMFHLPLPPQPPAASTSPHAWQRLRAGPAGPVHAAARASNARPGRRVEQGRNMKIHGYKVGPPKIAKLVYITPITMVYGTYNYS